MKYGDKRSYPKIAVWHKGNPSRSLVTTWSRTIKEARERYAEACGVPVETIGGTRS